MPAQQDLRHSSLLGRHEKVINEYADGVTLAELAKLPPDSRE